VTPSRVGGEARAKPVAEEGIDRAEPGGPRLHSAGDPFVVLEKPGELPGGEVRVEGHPASLPDLRVTPLRLQPVQDLLRTLVLPGDDRGQRPAALGVPREDRLALVVEPAGCNLGSVVQKLGDCADHRVDDHLRVLLHPAGLGMAEGLLAAHLFYRPKIGIEDHRLDGGRPLVDPQQEAHRSADGPVRKLAISRKKG
jgi:hypothetical protein